jgi:hypothetical protein
MAEQAAAVTEAAPAAPAAPAPKGPAPTTPQGKGESFAQTMERMAASLGDEPEAAEPDAEGAPEPAEKPETKAKGPKDKKVDENDKVLPSERAKFNNWKHKQAILLDRREQELLAKIGEREKAAEARIKKADAVEKAYELGDYDALAKALGAEDWNKLQEDVVSKLADPNYKRLRELEKFKAEQTEREEKQKREYKQQQAQRQRQEAIGKYFVDLKKQMTSSKDPLMSAMAEEPNFAQAIYRIQQEQWDGTETVTPEQALKIPAKGATKSLDQELKDLYGKLHKVYGGSGSSNGKAPPAAQKAAPKPAGKSAPIAGSRSTEASGEKRPLSSAERMRLPLPERRAYDAARMQELREYEHRRLEEAAAQERQERLRGEDS